MTADDTTKSILKRAYLKIEELERRLKEQDVMLKEPIAIVGIGCRFPGNIHDPESFWNLLTEGKDAIIPIPSDRWNREEFYSSDKSSTGKMYVDCGGFLTDDVSQFDPHFFGISAREARGLDPQQRLLLETAWQALENSGQNPDELSGTNTGIFLGVASNDYKQVVVQSRNLAEFNLYYLTGNAFSTASGRLSYFMGLNGPSITIDTACSASLTAVHYACQSIWTKESSVALAGGVNLVLSPEDYLSYCNASMISPTGRCKSFDSSADGFILSEGCGIVVLKRLSDAIKHNDTIYAVIRGSAVNQDGASNGLTAPNSQAQAMLIRQALGKANLKASDISYIEAHGSGTPLGDPIEVQGLASVFGIREENNPLIVGCVKTNIGHCAGAAGIAGLIKTILSIQHKQIPRNLHFSDANPLIPWNDITVTIPTEKLDWSPVSGVRRAGVSSFGVSGTNAHVILEDAPTNKSSGVSRQWQMFPLSAKSEVALNAMTNNLCSWIGRHPEIPAADVAYTLQTGRKNFPVRRFAVCRNSGEAITMFNQSGDLNIGHNVFSGRKPKVIFVFPGQGTQYPGMGNNLYDSEPVFRENFDKCADAFNRYIGEDLRQIVFRHGSDADTEKLKNTLYAQPAIFSIEYSLACLWQSWGIQPAALIGHSIGEFSAACFAGVMELEDAVSLVARRSYLMHSLPSGTMISVRASEEAIVPMLTPELSIAAINSPVLCVVSGPFETIAQFQSRCESVNIPCRPLHTSHAFHSSMVEPVLPDFKAHVDSIKLEKPKVPIMSTVTGVWLSENDAKDPMYWTRHMRVTVRFSAAVKRLMEEISDGIFLEAGPRSTSTTLIRQHFHDKTTHAVVASLSDNGEPESDLLALAKATGLLWMYGVTLDWNSYYSNEKRIRIPLPTYQFDRQRYWVDNVASSRPVFYDLQVDTIKKEPEPADSKEPVPDVKMATADEYSVNIRKLIATALGCSPESIDETSSFLHLGMDSLLMRQFSQQIKLIFNREITIRQLMREYATIQTLSSFIRSSGLNG